eukprot:m.50181 g.50181  ORF g.50181 m.50181 type:complete len:580 (-) comp7497_c1_seq1:107-1846(-)
MSQGPKQHHQKKECSHHQPQEETKDNNLIASNQRRKPTQPWNSNNCKLLGKNIVSNSCLTQIDRRHNIGLPLASSTSSHSSGPSPSSLPPLTSSQVPIFPVARHFLVTKSNTSVKRTRMFLWTMIVGALVFMSFYFLQIIPTQIVAARINLTTSEALKEISNHDFVFVVGAHHSGTTLLDLIISSGDNASGLKGTRVAQDEGQHLQSVYKPASKLGGILGYAYHAESFLDESSPLITDENRASIYKSWAPFWDTSKQFLVEKSPRHLVMTRFLQSIFGNDRTKFVVILRHPLAVWNWVLTTQPNYKYPCGKMFLSQWLLLHDALKRDFIHLDHVRVVMYEHLVGRSQEKTQEIVDKIFEFLGADGSPEVHADEADSTYKYDLLYGKMRSSHPWAFDKDGYFISVSSPMAQIPNEYRPDPYDPSKYPKPTGDRAHPVEPHKPNTHSYARDSIIYQEKLKTDRTLSLPIKTPIGARVLRNPSSGANLKPIVEHTSRNLGKGKRNGGGRQLLEFWGRRDKIVVHNGGVFDWTSTWDDIDFSSPLCKDSLGERMFKRVEEYGYSLTNLTEFHTPSIFKDILIE